MGLAAMASHMVIGYGSCGNGLSHGSRVTSGGFGGPGGQRIRIYPIPGRPRADDVLNAWADFNPDGQLWRDVQRSGVLGRHNTVDDRGFWNVGGEGAGGAGGKGVDPRKPGDWVCHVCNLCNFATRLTSGQLHCKTRGCEGTPYTTCFVFVQDKGWIKVVRGEDFRRDYTVDGDLAEVYQTTCGQAGGGGGTGKGTGGGAGKVGGGLATAGQTQPPPPSTQTVHPAGGTQAPLPPRAGEDSASGWLIRGILSAVPPH